MKRLSLLTVPASMPNREGVLFTESAEEPYSVFYGDPYIAIVEDGPASLV